MIVLTGNAPQLKEAAAAAKKRICDAEGNKIGVLGQSLSRTFFFDSDVQSI